MATMRFFYIVIHPWRISIITKVTNSLGTKLDMTFIIVSLKTETCLLRSRLLSKDSQSNRLMAFLYDRNLPWRNATQFFHKEEGKKPSNPILHRLFNDDN